MPCCDQTSSCYSSPSSGQTARCHPSRARLEALVHIWRLFIELWADVETLFKFRSLNSFLWSVINTLNTAVQLKPLLSRSYMDVFSLCSYQSVNIVQQPGSYCLRVYATCIPGWFWNTFQPVNTQTIFCDPRLKPTQIGGMQLEGRHGISAFSFMLLWRSI